MRGGGAAPRDDQLRDHLRDLGRGCRASTSAPRRRERRPIAELLAATAGRRAPAARRSATRRGAWIVGGAVRDAAPRAARCGTSTSPSPATTREAAAGDRAARPAGPCSGSRRSSRTWRALAADGAWHVDVSRAARRARSRRTWRCATSRSTRSPSRWHDPARCAARSAPAGSTDLDAAAPARRLRAQLRRRPAARPARRPDRRRRWRSRSTTGRWSSPARAAGRAGEPAGERQLAELRLLLTGADPIRGPGAARRAGGDGRTSCPSSRRCAASSRTPTTTSTSTATPSRCCGGCSRSRPISTGTPATARRRSRSSSPSRSPTSSPAAVPCASAPLVHDLGKPDHARAPRRATVTVHRPRPRRAP